MNLKEKRKFVYGGLLRRLGRPDLLLPGVPRTYRSCAGQHRPKHRRRNRDCDLPQRSLDYTVKPKLVANLQGDNGEQNAVGIEVPVHITGPWQQPDFSPDIAGAINSQGTVDAVKQIGKQLKGKNAGEIVNDLFGKGEDGGPSKAQKLLDGLFGKK